MDTLDNGGGYINKGGGWKPKPSYKEGKWNRVTQAQRCKLGKYLFHIPLQSKGK